MPQCFALHLLIHLALISFLGVSGESVGSVQSTRLVVTFTTSQDNIFYAADLGDAVAVKQYGRRLVLDMGREFDLDVESQFFRKMFRSVQSVEIDHIVTVQQLDISQIVINETLEVTQINQTEGNFDTVFISQGSQTPLWNLMDSELNSIHVEGAWKVTNSTPEIVVAILDTGIAEVAKGQFLNLLSGYDFISDDWVSIDGDGRDPDSTDPGDWADMCPVPSWHGTKVASILAARHDNPWGMKGVAQNCSVLPVRVIGICKMGYATDVADAIVWAAGGNIDGVASNPRPANIISLSLAGQGQCPDYLQSSINQALSLGARVISAAGNNNKHVSGYFPANCNGVLAVAAKTRQGGRASYSNYGTQFSAPGGDGTNAIMTLSVNAMETGIEVSFGMGTSFAAPHVAGVFSLRLAMMKNNVKRVWNASKPTDVSGSYFNFIGGVPRSGYYCTLYYPVNQFGVDYECDLEQECATCPTGQVRYMCGNTYSGDCMDCNMYCNVGEYLIQCSDKFEDNHQCVQCPAGKYADNSYWISKTSCELCPAQTYNSQAGSYVYYGDSIPCSPCPIGTDGGVGASVCDKCISGYVPATQNPLTCKQCGDGQYVAIGTQACTNCPAGKYIAGALAVCESCPTGTYGDSVGASACKECDAGKYSPASSSIVCTDCPTGTISIAKGSSACTSCSTGKYRSSLTACTDCNAGTYNPNSASNTCQGCPAGEISSANGMSACAPCTAGTFSLTGSSECTTCTTKSCGGTYYKVVCSLTSDTDCVSCTTTPGPSGSPPLNADFTRLDDSSCPWACNIGFYRNTAASPVTCELCSTDSSQCNSGEYRPTCPSTPEPTSSAACIACTNKPLYSSYTGRSKNTGLSECPYECNAGYVKHPEHELCCLACGNGFFNNGCTGTSPGECIGCTN